MAKIDWINPTYASYFQTPGSIFEWRFTGCVNPSSPRISQVNITVGVRIGSTAGANTYDRTTTCDMDSIAAASLTGGSVTTVAGTPARYTAATATYTVALTPSAGQDIAVGDTLTITFPSSSTVVYGFVAPTLTGFANPCTNSGAVLSCQATLARPKGVVRCLCPLQQSGKGLRWISPFV